MLKKERKIVLSLFFYIKRSFFKCFSCILNCFAWFFSFITCRNSKNSKDSEGKLSCVGFCQIVYISILIASCFCSIVIYFISSAESPGSKEAKISGIVSLTLLSLIIIVPIRALLEKIIPESFKEKIKNFNDFILCESGKPFSGESKINNLENALMEL